MSQSDPDFQRKDLTFLQTRDLLEQAYAYSAEYLAGIGLRRAYPSKEAIQNLAVFDEPLPQTPTVGGDILKMLHQFGSPATTASAGGRYFGFVNGGTLPAALAARWLADSWDQNAAMFASSPLASRIETVCEKWLVELLNLPAGTAAGFVSGSSTATLCALAAARDALLRRQGWDPAENGLFSAPGIRVILSEQAHATVFKALAILGLGRAREERVPCDDLGRMIPSCMPALDDSCLVIAQAGNVNSGAFDPIGEICALAQTAGAWVHVDGAFGLWAACSRAKRYLTAGVEMADSWTVDAHKTLNAPYDCGIVLCRERSALLEAMQISGAYIPSTGERDGMHYTPEMSRRARAVDIWAALKSLGREGVEELVDRLCSLALRFANGLKAEGFDILNEVVFNQVLVRCETPEKTQKTLEYIQQSGDCWCGGTNWMGEPAIRISVCSWTTTENDIDRSIEAFVQGRSLASME
jgi:glutamate/tyrosine decarboxylase-like PLP-dependent enzyme